MRGGPVVTEPLALALSPDLRNLDHRAGAMCDEQTEVEERDSDIQFQRVTFHSFAWQGLPAPTVGPARVSFTHSSHFRTKDTLLPVVFPRLHLKLGQMPMLCVKQLGGDVARVFCNPGYVPRRMYRV